MNGAPTLAERHGEALALVELALASKPQRDGDAFTAATQSLSRFREAFIAAQAERPTPGDRDRLSKLSAVLAMVIAGHFPLGATQWDDVAKARDWLADLAPKG